MTLERLALVVLVACIGALLWVTVGRSTGHAVTCQESVAVPHLGTAIVCEAR